MIKPIRFGNHSIGEEHPVYIIAEIGVNHEGSVENCAKMIEEAAKAGVDAIKLQTVDPDENYVPGTESYDLFSRCALSREETAAMFDYAWKLGVDPFTTSPDPITLEWVDKLKPAGHKISSGMMTNSVIIRKTCETGRPLLMSTGMAGQEQIDEAVGWIEKYGNKEKAAIFQCTSIYPAPLDSLNLAAIRGMQDRYTMHAGFSDHSEGIEAAGYAVFAGARMVEKHFSLDKTRDGFDHRLSLEPKEMQEMVERVRFAEKVYGQADKQIAGALKENANKFLRTIVARCDIKEGETLSEENLALKRPLPDKRGLEPKHYDGIIGQKAKQAIKQNEPITSEHIGKYE